ncbi:MULTISPECIES: PLP-dependent aminotransferase family protein [unclassified Staphylococcus]|uniref:aminotransferase-like domain-containing protein n=1 Tax=unclassified Staphylococcus TaxID=91994 RepID=UPI0021D2D32D|nr:MULTISPECIES: PLP-dependent aminotransferase family protein [unclassified Staphylococcus]UXR71638.1 PLP-dependent aminotransferase family protein [Staphylococcus sp. IVB6240]UXR73912.1 PLP-dependent aminotransferase family protein [Staphylococcus sp. IVB6238]UXR76234.1 PLP-dependent aminotransferase family protein [Staphylococcus sp. IVB6233]UXR80432.1 PLP-dependent aminotransferase family protein [Staphylococcus sp. IVB6218]
MLTIKYKDIATYIRDKIISGNWFYGMKIPSQRQLAKQFHVNRVTIIKSIELLEAEGFIYTKQGSGTYVNDYLNEDAITQKWSDMMVWSLSARNQYTVQLINKLETDTTYLHISKGELGKDLIPHIALKKAMTTVSHYIGDLSFGYYNGYGYDQLRALIAQRLCNQGINVTQDNVLITPGALHAIQLITTGFLSRHTVILSHSPSYIDSTSLFSSLHSKNIKIPYNTFHHFHRMIEQLPSHQDKALYIQPAFNNPTGQSLSQHTKEAVVKYCECHHIPIIEDDIYRDIWFKHSENTPMKLLDQHGTVLHISSFSKSIAPALRIGWIVASEKIIEQLADIRMQNDYGSSILSQMVIYEMLKNGDYDQHLQKLRDVLKIKRDAMLKTLDQYYTDIATWKIPEGGFFVWLTFTNNINIKQLFATLIDKEKILINPGFIYGSQENTVRLSYAFESIENISFVLKKIRQYL